MNTRELILDILLEWEQGTVFCHRLLQNVLQKYDYLDSRDKAFIKKVVQGTIERKIQMDYILNLFSSVPVHKMKRVIRNILRSSVYQIMFLDVPDGVVCNEAVKLAAKRRFGTLKGYVNGVLRQVARKKDEISYPDPDSDWMEYLSVRYSMPPFLVEHFTRYYSGQAEAIMAGFLESKPVCIRLSPTLEEPQIKALEQAWEESGVLVSAHPYLPYARLLAKTGGVASLAGYESGAFAVQDISSMLVCEAADIQPGMQVLDVCAAPGGKTVHAAQKTGSRGQVRAFDISPAKLDLIRENLERMRITNVQAEEQDAALYRSELEQSADVLLADVPCSGLGVIGKKQDIKYRADEKSLQEIVVLQRAILKNVCNYVKKGGVLLYSTCTIHPEENERMVQWMEEELPVVREDIAPYLPDALKGSVREKTLQLLPGIHESDGFFIARMRRTRE